MVTTRLVIDRRRLRATLYRSGKRFWSTRVGIGAPDAPTPRGKFWIRETLQGARQHDLRPVRRRHERLLRR